MKFRESKKQSAGFTILEIVVVLTIMAIIAGAAIPIYQRILLHSKETVLHQDLHLMRQQIDKYAADRDESPGSLDDMVRAGYLREIPEDPITGSNQTWEVVMETEPMMPNGKIGIKDVFSGADGTGTDGKSYKDW
ncbi:MAG TPA: prepilin-type N-terminal cleavage/methylation domain-containing protein [Blastocatellia bacterium]|nr:prepilin-type N-terminal cleavage/methylation domain-containing protein [Blastocatellia bacterium]